MITLSSVGWAEGRVVTARWPFDPAIDIAASDVDEFLRTGDGAHLVAHAGQVPFEMDWRALTPQEEIHVNEMALVVARSDRDRSADPAALSQTGWLRRLVECFRMGVLEIRGLRVRRPDGQEEPFRPERVRDGGYLKWPMELIGMLDRAQPQLVGIVGSFVARGNVLMDAERKASSPAHGAGASGDDGTVPAALLNDGPSEVVPTSP